MDPVLQILFIFLGTLVFPVGFFGGRWLWQKMAQSPLLSSMQNFIRPVGIVGTIAMFAGAITCVGAIFVLSEATLQGFARPLSMGGAFLLAYLVGYDISIMKKQTPQKAASVPESPQEFKRAFHVKWKLVMNVFEIVFLFSLLSYLIFYGLSLIPWYYFFDAILMAIGGSLGFLFWEHLKDTGMLTGTFLKQLLALSLITTGVMVFLYRYAIYVGVSPGVPDAPQILFLALALFMECMGWYMLSLLLNTKHQKLSS